MGKEMGSWWIMIVWRINLSKEGRKDGPKEGKIDGRRARQRDGRTTESKQMHGHPSLEMDG